MADEVSRLSLAVDSSQVKTAGSELDKLAASGARAETATTALEQAARGAGQGLSQAARGAQAVGAAQAGIQAGANAAAGSLGQAGNAAKLTAFQAQQLGFQLNDLFVQIASGQSPVTALVQQGSQLSGTFGGLRGTFAALATVFTPVRLLIGGAATVVAGLALAFEKGRSQSQEFQRSLILTGNAAGITEDKFNSLAQAIARSTNTTIGSTRETLQGLVSSGRFSGAALEQAATAAQLMSKVTGQSGDDILKSFVSAADGIGKFAEQTNRQYNFLSAAQLKYVRELEETGQGQKALEVVFASLNGRLKEAAGEVGLLERAYQGLKNAASAAADAILSIGRRKTPQQQVQDIEGQIAALRATASLSGEFGGGGVSAELEIQRLEERAEALRETIGLQERSAAAAAQQVQQQQALSVWDRLRSANLSREQQLAKALEDANKAADAAGVSAAERAQVLGAILERFGGPDVRKALLDQQITKIRSALQAQVGAFQNAESILDAVRQAGLTDEREFYEAKRAFVASDAALRVKALEDEAAAIRASARGRKEQIDAEKESARLRAEAEKIKADAAARGIILTIQEKTAVDALNRALRESRIEAELAIERAKRRSALDVGLSSSGDGARSRAQGLFEIEERYAQKREALDAKYADTKDARQREAYAAQIALTEELQAREVEAFNRAADAKLEAEARWESGASRAFANYLEQAANVALQTEQIFSNAFRGLEDVSVNFLTKGKADWKGFADAVVADILRIIVRQQIAAAASAALGFFGGGGAAAGSSIGAALGAGRADGGSVTRGGIYPVNERGGPGELLTVGSKQYLMAASDGRVTPQGAGGAGRPVQVTQTFVIGSNVDRRSQQQVAAQAGRGVSVAMSRNE